MVSFLGTTPTPMCLCRSYRSVAQIVNALLTVLAQSSEHGIPGVEPELEPSAAAAVSACSASIRRSFRSV